MTPQSSEFSTWGAALTSLELPEAFAAMAQRKPLVGVSVRLVGDDAQGGAWSQIFATAGPGHGIEALKMWSEEASAEWPVPFRGALELRLDDPISGHAVWRCERELVVGALREYRARLSVEREQSAHARTQRRLDRSDRRLLEAVRAAPQLMDAATSVVWASRGVELKPGQSQTELERLIQALGKGVLEGIQAPGRPPPVKAPDGAQVLQLRGRLRSAGAWLSEQAEHGPEELRPYLATLARQLGPVSTMSGDQMLVEQASGLQTLESLAESHPDSEVLLEAGRRISGDPDWTPTPLSSLRVNAAESPEQELTLGMRVLLAVADAPADVRSAVRLLANGLPASCDGDHQAAQALTQLNILFKIRQKASHVPEGIDAAMDLIVQDLSAHGFTAFSAAEHDLFDPTRHKPVDLDGPPTEDLEVCEFLGFGVLVGETVKARAQVRVGHRTSIFDEDGCVRPEFNTPGST